MAEDLQAVELQEIYQQADAECRKKIAEAAAQLLKAQKSLDDKPEGQESEKPSAEKKQAN